MKKKDGIGHQGFWSAVSWRPSFWFVVAGRDFDGWRHSCILSSHTLVFPILFLGTNVQNLSIQILPDLFKFWSVVEAALSLFSWWLETSWSLTNVGHNSSPELASTAQTSSCARPSSSAVRLTVEFGFYPFHWLFSTKMCLEIKLHWQVLWIDTLRAWECLKLELVAVDEPLWGCLDVVHWHGTAGKPLTSLQSSSLASAMFTLFTLYWSVFFIDGPEWRYSSLAWTCL